MCVCSCACVRACVRCTRFIVESPVHARRPPRGPDSTPPHVTVSTSFILNWPCRYCQRFGQFRDLAKVTAVRDLLSESNLHPFEQAALANLCPSDAEEAIALLPRWVYGQCTHALE